MTQIPRLSGVANAEEESLMIVDVWKDNLEEEFARIRDLVELYPVISMDTEFPGEVFKPMGPAQENYFYEKLRVNVDRLNLIQIGFTFSDKEGKLPEGTCTWQFNFNFNINKDAYFQDSINLLKDAGINFEKHKTQGIDATLFAELLTTSGLVLNDEITWVTFHSTYDFGYLLKILTNDALPAMEQDFYKLLELFFPHIYDIKILSGTKHGLNKLAEEMKVKRQGSMHQAGSDSLVTSKVFFRVVEKFFQGNIDPKYMNKIAGLGIEHTMGQLRPRNQTQTPSTSSSSSNSTDQQQISMMPSSQLGPQVNMANTLNMNPNAQQLINPNGMDQRMGNINPLGQMNQGMQMQLGPNMSNYGNPSIMGFEMNSQLQMHLSPMELNWPPSAVQNSLGMMNTSMGIPWDNTGGMMGNDQGGHAVLQPYQQHQFQHYTQMHNYPQQMMQMPQMPPQMGMGSQHVHGGNIFNQTVQ